MSDLGRLLLRITDLAEQARREEDALAETRSALYATMREAHDKGASFAVIGDAAGMSRQRASKVVQEDGSSSEG